MIKIQLFKIFSDEYGCMLGTVLSVNKGNKPLLERSSPWYRKCIFPGRAWGHCSLRMPQHKLGLMVRACGPSIPLVGQRIKRRDPPPKTGSVASKCTLLLAWFCSSPVRVFLLEYWHCACPCSCSVATERLKIKCAANSGLSRRRFQVCSIAGAVVLSPMNTYGQRSL